MKNLIRLFATGQTLASGVTGYDHAIDGKGQTFLVLRGYREFRHQGRRRPNGCIFVAIDR